MQTVIRSYNQIKGLVYRIKVKSKNIKNILSIGKKKKFQSSPLGSNCSFSSKLMPYIFLTASKTSAFVKTE